METLCSAVVFPSFKIRTSQFSKCGSIRASLAIEQQTSQTKVALLRIGTRGRYSTLPFIIMLSIMSIYCNGVSLYDKFTGVLKIFNSEFSERTTSFQMAVVLWQKWRQFLCFYLKFDCQNKRVLLFAAKCSLSRLSNDYLLHHAASLCFLFEVIKVETSEEGLLK